MKRIVAGAVLAIATFALPVAAFADDRIDEGFAAAENYDYAGALKWFRAAGEGGNVQGARIAGFMLLYGEGLYGPFVKQDRAAAISLLQKAAAGGDEVSAVVVRKLVAGGTPPLPIAAATLWREPD